MDGGRVAISLVVFLYRRKHANHPKTEGERYTLSNQQESDFYSLTS